MHVMPGGIDFGVMDITGCASDDHQRWCGGREGPHFRTYSSGSRPRVMQYREKFAAGISPETLTVKQSDVKSNPKVLGHL